MHLAYRRFIDSNFNHMTRPRQAAQSSKSQRRRVAGATGEHWPSQPFPQSGDYLTGFNSLFLHQLQYTHEKKLLRLRENLGIRLPILPPQKLKICTVLNLYTSGIMTQQQDGH